MFLLPALITIVMPLHRLGSANVAASVCLYRERERALRFWLIVQPYPTAGLGYPILPGRQSRPLVARHICIMTGVLWRRRPSCCTPFCAPVLPRRRLVVQRRPTWGRGHGDAPARRPGADRPFRIPGHAPSVGPSPGRFATFWVRHCPLCRSIDGVLASAGNSVGSQPAIPLCAHIVDPTPITPVKGTYSGEIESLKSQHVKLRMRSEPPTNRSWKFDNRLYFFKTAHRFPALQA